MRNYKSLILLILVICLPFQLHSQEIEHKYTYSLGGSVFKGFVYRHTQSIGHLINAHPTGFELYASKSTYGDKPWQSLYNYPDVGFSFIMIDFHSQELGKSYGAMIYNDIYLNSHSQNNHLKLRIGGGIGYHTEHYDINENPKNNIVSTDFSYALQARLEYGYAFRKWKITSALSLTHFSNGAVKKPNKGVNVPSFNIGVSKNISNYQLEHKAGGSPLTFDPSLHFNFNISWGLTSTEIVKDKTFMSLNFSTYADKRISRRSIINAGLDVFLNYALKEHMKYDYDIEGELPDFKRVGLVAGHELFMGRTAILIQMGYYVYRPYELNSLLYQRYGLKYFINERYFTSIYLKAHNANAEMAEWALGMRF